MVTSEQRKDIVRRIADDIWNRGDLAAVDEVMAATAKYHGPHMPGGTGGRESWRGAIAMYRAALPDSHVVFDELIAHGNTIVGRWSATGTHMHPLPGVAPTGKRIAITGITIYRFARGKIVEAWEQLDMLGMWQQLGVITLPRGEPPSATLRGE
jgi:predicted ester cyclase